MQPILSILICTLHKRTGALGALLRVLQEQIEDAGVTEMVEILIKVDGGEMPTGTKRNALVRQALGKYVCHCDDDDAVFPGYIREILRAAETDCDCMAIKGIMTTDGKKVEKWEIAKDHPYKAIKDDQGANLYLRHTNHLSPTKRTIAMQIPFPDETFGEDYAYSVALKNSGLLKTETVIDPPIYHYKYVSCK
jgi:glycosyltransferase involved in cell wall biosynthesis